MLLDLMHVHNFHYRMINVISFCVNNSSSSHTDYKRKDGPANEQDDITITAEAKYSVNIMSQERKVARVYTTMQPKNFCMIMV